MNYLPVIVAFIVGSVLGFMYNGHRLDAKYTAEKMAVIEEARAHEARMEDVNYQLTLKLDKEKQDAEKTIAGLRRDIASQRVRLTVPVRACESTGLKLTEARAELDAETAEELVGIAADGDAAIRELNYCIDAYNSIKETAK